MSLGFGKRMERRDKKRGKVQVCGAKAGDTELLIYWPSESGFVQKRGGHWTSGGN